MANKLKVYIDVDETTIQSIPAVSQWYIEKYSTHLEFKTPDPKLVKQWNFADQMPLLTKEDIIEVFDSKFFFDNVRLKPYCYEALERLHKSRKFELVWMSIGTTRNLVKKSIYLRDKFPFIKKFKMIERDKVFMGGKAEEIEDANSSVLIDDHVSNLSGFKYPILFKERDAEWNQNWDGFKVGNWLELELKLEALYALDNLYGRS